MPRKRLPGGKIVEVMEGESREASMKRLISTGEATLADFQQARPKLDLQAEYSKENKKIVDQMGGLEKAAVGYMETLDTAAGRVAEMFGIDTGYEERRQATQDVEGIAAGMGRAVPSIAAGMLAGPSLAAQIPVGAATGALTANDAKTGAVTGAAFAGAGNMIGKVAGRVGNGIRGKWAERVVRGVDEESDAIRKLANLGFKLTPGRAAGKGMKVQLDSVLEQNPILGTAYSSIRTGNNRLLTNIGSKAVGLKKGVNDIGPQALKNMKSSLDDTFNEVAELVKKPVVQAKNAVHYIKQMGGQSNLLRPQTLARLKIKEADLTNGLTGRQYMNLRSELLKITRRPQADNADLAWDAMNALDDAMDQVSPPGFDMAYKVARERFKNLLVIQKYEGGLGAGGHLNPVALNRAAKKIYKDTYDTLGAIDPKTGQMTRPLLDETDDFLHAIKGLSTTRMKGMGGEHISANVSLYGTGSALGYLAGAALGVGGVAGIAAAVPTGIVGSRAAMAAASPAFARALGAAGTGVASQVADEIQ